MAFKDGPFVQVACFCEMVLEDKTGVLTLIRVIDTITQTAAGPNPPEDMPPMSFNTRLVIMLKSGEARGRSTLKVVPQLPTGATKSPIDITVYFDGDERGQNVITNMTFVCEMEGLYWFNLYIDNEKLTAIPLRVKYNRVIATSTPTL